MKGIYVLILKLDCDINIQIGRLGVLFFKKGFYAYAGSARGTGGFKRVTRHFNVASGKNSTRKWHIDYLLPHTRVVCAVLLPTDEELECAVAGTLENLSDGIPGFGCSDCFCRSHLFFSVGALEGRVIDACNRLTGNESIIINPRM